MRGAPRTTHRLLYRRECFRIIVVATDVTESRQKVLQGAPVVDAARTFDAIRYSCV